MRGFTWIAAVSQVHTWQKWAKKAGLVTSQAHFEDIYGLDDDVRPTDVVNVYHIAILPSIFNDQLLAIVPRPVKAVVLLFPIDAEGDAKRQEEDEKIAREGQPKIDNTVFWIKQTVFGSHITRKVSSWSRVRYPMLAGLLVLYTRLQT